LAIIHEGGDADTNAAVAGALLGARFGCTGIPQEWLDGLVFGPELEERVERLIARIHEPPGG
jgi:ADP-ribosylglycohydrolase